MVRKGGRWSVTLKGVDLGEDKKLTWKRRTGGGGKSKRRKPLSKVTKVSQNTVRSRHFLDALDDPRGSKINRHDRR